MDAKSIKNVEAILAQSVERTALNRVVEGSIPSDRDFFPFLFFNFKFNSINFKFNFIFYLNYFQSFLFYIPEKLASLKGRENILGSESARENALFSVFSDSPVAAA